MTGLISQIDFLPAPIAIALPPQGVLRKSAAHSPGHKTPPPFRKTITFDSAHSLSHGTFSLIGKTTVEKILNTFSLSTVVNPKESN